METVATPSVPQPIKLTIEEVIVVEMEVDNSNDAGTYQAYLDFRGTEEQPALYLDENMFYNWKCLGSLTPLPRGKVMPKLAKMGIPMTILTELTVWSASSCMIQRPKEGVSPTMYLDLTGTKPCPLTCLWKR